ncbi:MAG: endonuclease domain-containing protein [Spirochaetes bacterium]|nr:endonuclease domain-containing protein [Spirochaetota bacterium]
MFIRKSTAEARGLRARQTEAEKMLWQHLRNRKLNGMKFTRQHVIRFMLDGEQRCFIADFYCAEAGLCIEIDGQIHEQQKEYDDARTVILSVMGKRVLRFSNNDVQNNVNEVLAVIEKETGSPPLSYSERGGVMRQDVAKEAAPWMA